MLGVGAGAVGSSSSSAEESRGWKAGLVRAVLTHNVQVIALADKYPGITHTFFIGCDNLTDAAVVALADKCPGIEHASFRGDENLADAAVVALADKCPGVNALKLCFVQEADGCSSDCVGRQVPWSHARRFWLLLRLEEFNESSLEAVKEHAHTLQF
eukprot:gene12485-biopygen5297